MKPVFNLEPKYSVTMLTREDWTRGPGTPPVVKGLIWFTDGSRNAEGTGAGVYGQSADRRLSVSLGKHVTVFQAEVYEILDCVQGTETQDRPEKYVSTCSDSQAALKALQAAKTTSPLVRQCQKALNDISTRHAMGLYWVPGHAGVRGNEIADKLARDSSVQRFVGPEPFPGVYRQNTRRKMKCWMEKQHLVLWCGPCSTQRQAQGLISCQDLVTRATLSFNRTQSRIVTGLLAGINTLRRYLYTMRVSNNPICRKCGTEEETSVHILCVCVSVRL
jgi:ribonuclease HI